MISSICPLVFRSPIFPIVRNQCNGNPADAAIVYSEKKGLRETIRRHFRQATSQVRAISVISEDDEIRNIIVDRLLMLRNGIGGLSLVESEKSIQGNVLRVYISMYPVSLSEPFDPLAFPASCLFTLGFSDQISKSVQKSFSVYVFPIKSSTGSEKEKTDGQEESFMVYVSRQPTFSFLRDVVFGLLFTLPGELDKLVYCSEYG